MATIELSPVMRRAFRAKIYGYFKRQGREFSWRKTRDPYHIFVAEIMLQQTQTSRVDVKFPEFTAAFPDFAALAAAKLSDVVRLWQGMGYNRRALFLHRAAQTVMRAYGGKLPATVDELQKLPGVGPATARSIAAYAFNLPVVFIETNIRTFIHEFFAGRATVHDDDIAPLVEQTLDRRDPWKWYNALMDYGVMLKELHGNPGRRSAHYTRQSAFKDSDRRIRGELLRHIAQDGPQTLRSLYRQLSFPQERIKRCLQTLLKDGLLQKKAAAYRIP